MTYNRKCFAWISVLLVLIMFYQSSYAIEDQLKDASQSFFGLSASRGFNSEYGFSSGFTFFGEIKGAVITVRYSRFILPTLFVIPDETAYEISALVGLRLKARNAFATFSSGLAVVTTHKHDELISTRFLSHEYSIRVNQTLAIVLDAQFIVPFFPYAGLSIGASTLVTPHDFNFGLYGSIQIGLLR